MREQRETELLEDKEYLHQLIVEEMLDGYSKKVRNLRVAIFSWSSFSKVRDERLSKSINNIFREDKRFESTAGNSEGHFWSFSKEGWKRKDLNGLYLKAPHAKLIYDGKKKLIIKSKEYNIEGKRFLLLDKDFAYGWLTIGEIYSIDLTDFRGLEKQHCISDKERTEWWNGQTKFYAYPFKFESFAEPRSVQVPQGVQTFVHDVKFIVEQNWITSPLSCELIRDIKTYNPTEIEDAVLRDDWRIVCAWYSSAKSGKKMPYSFEEIENLALLILKEMLKRGMEIHPENYKEYAKELVEKTLKRIKQHRITVKEAEALFGNKYGEVNYGGETKGSLLRLDDVLRQIKGFKVKKPWVYIVGGICNHGETTGDIDILIREEERNLPLEFRIYRQFPKEMWHRFHFIYDNDRFGPFTNHVQLFDQEAVCPFELQVEEMSLEDDELAWKPFRSPAGKSLQVPVLKRYIPRHKTYCEPFCGGASLFFNKEPSENEVLNDTDLEIMTAFKIIQTLTDKEFEELKTQNWKGSVELFKKLKSDKPKERVFRLYRFLYLSHHSYMGLRKFPSKWDIERGREKKNFDKYLKARERLKNTKLYCKDFELIVKEYDSENTFFYFDPPYFNEKDFPIKPRDDFQSRLLDVLEHLKGKFLLSFAFFSKENCDYFRKMKFEVKKIKVKKGSLRWSPERWAYELIVANYPLKYYDEFGDERIEPFKFFKQLKGIVGYRKLETYNIQGLKNTIEQIEDFYPSAVQVKFDGFRCQIHRVGNKVKIWSEDGGDVTERFPSICEEIKKWQWAAIVDCEITGWINGYLKGRHLGRSDVSGYAHRKDKPEDKNFFANVFDILWVNDVGDLHKQPYSERLEHLAKKPSSEHIKIAETHFAKNPEELEKEVRWAACQKG